MPSPSRVAATALKFVPLALYVRAACCKFDLPILGCDGPRCPYGSPAAAERMFGVVAFPVANDSDKYNDVEASVCTPTGNTAEVRHWCEHGWVGWLNHLLYVAGTTLKTSAKLKTSCSEPSFVLLRVLGGLELAGYVLLWAMPQLGALWLAVFMGAGLHFHLSWLKESAADLALQFVLFFAAILVLYLEVYLDDIAESIPAPPPGPPPSTAASASRPKGKEKKAAKAD